jgi:hypothetical protein
MLYIQKLIHAILITCMSLEYTNEHIKVYIYLGCISSTSRWWVFSKVDQLLYVRCQILDFDDVIWMITVVAMSNDSYHIMLYRVHLTCTGFELTTSVVIGTHCLGSCKSNYHTITITAAPLQDFFFKSCLPLVALQF